VSTLFAPMIVRYNALEYVAAGIVSMDLPLAFGLKIKKENLEESTANVSSVGPSGAAFLLHPYGEHGFRHFQIVPVGNCEFVRYVDQCLMCRAPKMENP